MERDTKDKSESAQNAGQSEGTLKRRGDNVGQSGRWNRGDPGAERYGNEERFHSTEHPVGAPAEPPQREPNTDRPNAGPYEGRFARPDEDGEQHGDDKSRYDTDSYAQAGGIADADPPTHPDDGRWQDEAGAGYGERYGSGRDAGGNGTERPAPKRRPT